MVDRINLILKAKNLTSRQFAEEIGIQPSGMSHILGGRNRPSLDFVMKVVTRYPEIDIKWLTLGEGEMYVSPYSMPVAPSSSVSAAASSPVVQPSAPAPAVKTPEPAQASLWSEPDLFSAAEPVPEPVPVVDEPPEAELEESSTVEVEPEPLQQQPQPQLDENRLYDFGKPAGVENQNLKKKKIMKVVILYDDHSFSEYYPE